MHAVLLAINPLSSLVADEIITGLVFWELFVQWVMPLLHHFSLLTEA